MQGEITPIRENAMEGQTVQTRDRGLSSREHRNDSLETRDDLLRSYWDEIDAAGAWVEAQTGDLFRVPQEALVRGASPLIQKVSQIESEFIRVSDDPYCPILKAREVSANNNVRPNF